MSVADVKKNTDQKMQKSIETLKNDLAKVRTGRAHVGMLDHVQVDYYGTPTHINQVANVTLLDARTIGVVDNQHLLVGGDVRAIHQVTIDGDRADVVEIGSRDGGFVDLGAEVGAHEEARARYRAGLDGSS